jgi:hypothetical protein
MPLLRNGIGASKHIESIELLRARCPALLRRPLSGQSRKDLLTLRISGFDPERPSASVVRQAPAGAVPTDAERRVRQARAMNAKDHL